MISPHRGYLCLFHQIPCIVHGFSVDSARHFNIDNPKIAARHFLNAISRVDSLKEKYQKTMQEMERNVPMLQQLVAKPFEKENELAQLKKDASKLEREISFKIKENQMKPQNVPNEINFIEKETQGKHAGKSLLPKKETENKKAKGIRI